MAGRRAATIREAAPRAKTRYESPEKSGRRSPRATRDRRPPRYCVTPSRGAPHASMSGVHLHASMRTRLRCWTATATLEAYWRQTTTLSYVKRTTSRRHDRAKHSCAAGPKIRAWAGAANDPACEACVVPTIRNDVMLAWQTLCLEMQGSLVRLATNIRGCDAVCTII